MTRCNSNEWLILMNGSFILEVTVLSYIFDILELYMCIYHYQYRSISGLMNIIIN